jgi:hypothetical protein
MMGWRKANADTPLAGRPGLSPILGDRTFSTARPRALPLGQAAERKVREVPRAGKPDLIS